MSASHLCCCGAGPAQAIPGWERKLLCDGLHLTPEGQQEVYRLLRALIDERFPDLRWVGGSVGGARGCGRPGLLTGSLSAGCRRWDHGLQASAAGRQEVAHPLPPLPLGEQFARQAEQARAQMFGMCEGWSLCPSCRFLCSVAKLPMDAPDHSWIDPDSVPAAFSKHWAEQQQRAQQQDGTAAKEEL